MFIYSMSMVTSTPWVKITQDTKLLPITSLKINRFSKFFHDRLSSKFATKSCLNIPPHLKYIATLPREIRMSENWQQSEICIVINGKWQGNVARHLRCDELLCYTFITLSSGERIFKIGEHLAKLQAKWSIVSYAPFALNVFAQRWENSPDK